MEQNQTPQQSTVNSEPSTVLEQKTPITVHSSPSTFLVVLLSILLLISVSVAGFFAYQTQKLVKQLSESRNQNLATQTPTPTTDPTADLSRDEDLRDWKIYTDTENNYQLSYPPTWKIDNSDKSFFQIIPSDEGPNGEGRIVITVDTYSKNLNQFMETTNVSTGTKNSDIFTLIQEIKIGGKNGVLTKGGCCGFFGQHAFSQYNDKLYKFSLKGPVDNPQIKFQSIFNQILSTFKFIN